jgi:hypothetical protein
MKIMDNKVFDIIDARCNHEDNPSLFDHYGEQ